MCFIDIKNYLRNTFDIHYKTEDGLKYQVIGEEVKITGYTRNINITEIPSYIADLPVGIISGLQSIPFVGELHIPDTVHTIENNALNCTEKITRIILPDSVRKIGACAFSFNQSLEEIRFPEGMDFTDTLEAVTDGCSKLKTVSLPSTMKRIPTGFLSDCESLEEIFIPDNVTEIGDIAFMYDSSLKTVHFPIALKKIEEMAFCNCTALEELVLPEGLEIIEKSAFAGCKKLRNIYLPSTLKRIEKYAFDDCDALEKPHIPSGCEVHEKAFG